MAANDNINVSYQQAQDLQRELERTLQKLERTGLLRQAGGDEVRTIVAEDIAEHFGERYRVFPAGVKHEGLNIRRDSVPKTCVLRARIAERVSVASQASCSRPGTGSLHDGNSKSSPKRSVAPLRGVTNKRVQKWAAGVPSLSSHSTSSEKKAQRNWGEDLTDAADARWEAIFSNPPKLSASSSIALSGSSVSTGQGRFQAAASISDSPTKKADARVKVVVAQGPLSAVQEDGLEYQTKGIIDVNGIEKLIEMDDDATQLIVSTPPRRAAPSKVESDGGDLIDFSP